MTLFSCWATYIQIFFRNIHNIDTKTVKKPALVWKPYPIFIYIIKPTCCQNNPAESILWMHLHQFQYLFHDMAITFLLCNTVFFANLNDDTPFFSWLTLRWRHNGGDSVSNHQPGECLFTQPFNWVQIKENIKAPRRWPLCGEFTGDRWIPRTNGQ